jgi:hypothetical protein
MFEDQYVELLPARTTMKMAKPKRRGGSYGYGGHGGNSTNIGGSGGSGGSGGDGGLGLNIGLNTPVQVSVFGDNSNTFSQSAGNGGAGGAGGAGGRAG